MILEESVYFNKVEFSHEQISAVVDSFYRKVQEDEVLKEPFRSVQEWPKHIERLTHFWWSRFGGAPYMDAIYDPMGKHYEAGLDEAFLSRWLGLFHETLGEHLSPEQVHAWTKLAERMGAGLLAGNEALRKKWAGPSS